MKSAGPQILGTGAKLKRVPHLKSCRVNRAYNKRIFLVFEMRFGMNEFDHRISGLLKFLNYHHLSHIYGLIIDPHNAQLPVGQIAQPDGRLHDRAKMSRIRQKMERFQQFLQRNSELLSVPQRVHRRLWTRHGTDKSPFQAFLAAA